MFPLERQVLKFVFNSKVEEWKLDAEYSSPAMVFIMPFSAIDEESMMLNAGLCIVRRVFGSGCGWRGGSNGFPEVSMPLEIFNKKLLPILNGTSTEVVNLADKVMIDVVKENLKEPNLPSEQKPPVKLEAKEDREQTAVVSSLSTIPELDLKVREFLKIILNSQPEDWVLHNADLKSFSQRTVIFRTSISSDCPNEKIFVNAAFGGDLYCDTKLGFYVVSMQEKTFNEMLLPILKGSEKLLKIRKINGLPVYVDVEKEDLRKPRSPKSKCSIM